MNREDYEFLITIIFFVFFSVIAINSIIGFSNYHRRKQISLAISDIDAKQNQIIMLLSRHYIDPPIKTKKLKQEKQ